MYRAYLDNAATTPVAPEVRDAMEPYWREDFGNASSVHWHGQRARSAVEEAREQVAGLINARPEEIVFTSGGTEADNAALFGVALCNRKGRPSGRDGRARADEAASFGDALRGATNLRCSTHTIISAIEHHAVLHAARALQQYGVEVTCVPVGPSGVLDPAEIEKAVRPETVLISIMHANNEIGTVQPIEEIGRVARAQGITFHTDAVQSAGKIAIDVEKLGADLLTLSAHKIYGPKGVGALYIRKGTGFRPLIYGGHHERDRRAGTENVPGIVGMGKAAELAHSRMENDSWHVSALRDRLEKGIMDRVPFAAINGDPVRRLPGVSNLSFGFVDGEALVIALDLRGVACSTGAACSSGSLEPSHVLAAIGLAREQARSSVRFSLGRYNTAEDVDHALAMLPEVVERLRSLSPRYAVRAVQ